jgi:predicted amidohydrolase YtcJ
VADFIVLDRDLTTVSAPEILKTRVVRTVVDGRTVYQAPGAQMSNHRK